MNSCAHTHQQPYLERSRLKFGLSLLSSVVIATIATDAVATNGYFSNGYGVKSLGMGGVGIALPQDALAAATNPAGMGLIGDRVDFGLTWFKPNRESRLRNTAGGSGALDGTYDGNDTDNFFIPEFGYNRQINPDVTLGVSVYGNGGMNTDYSKGIPYFNTTGSRTGIDFSQLFVAPTATWKFAPGQVIGLAVNLAYERFEAKGLQNFDNPSFTSATGHVTNRGHDNAFGGGIRIGWIGQLNDTVTLGATYQTKTYFSKFDKYKGLFANGGEMGAPANYGLGIAFKATPQLTLAADVQRILYSDSDTIGNLSLATLFSGKQLGSSNGPGFGWRDVTATKIGASYAYNDNLILRAGYDHTSQPIRKSETLFNILAPGVVQDHLSLGATWTLPTKGELSFFYSHAFRKTVHGSGSIPLAGFGGGEADLSMQQNSAGIAYGWNL
ncbi:long-chain fatty acid transport protein [Novimethylophilus kurashikiensis]|uniref:Long-chain fatty acid transport protein n=1 Tax=Novimethylophilus kurashikiensis TaxID=1825523 RepID=A0A2R5FA48_9PROT|nr:outer membrane protein transport protein [Novimethylophilus kurashikiensis]GBG13793.1 long-chain fatty acid transport protein [Novimethylophilus kurashikiensis]